MYYSHPSRLDIAMCVSSYKNVEMLLIIQGLQPCESTSIHCCCPQSLDTHGVCVKFPCGTTETTGQLS